MFDSTIFVVKTMILKKETSRRFGYARGKEKPRRNTLEAEPTSNRRVCGTILQKKRGSATKLYSLQTRALVGVGRIELPRILVPNQAPSH